MNTLTYRVVATSPMGGLEYTVAYLTGVDLEAVYELYKKERRDIHDPYAFVEYALRVDFTRVKEPKKAATLFKFN